MIRLQKSNNSITVSEYLKKKKLIPQQLTRKHFNDIQAFRHAWVDSLIEEFSEYKK